ncbi:MAG: histidinol dehydrogenase [Bacteroidetes bacterium]|nr:MAG: histidinol dehydrogenase [Bacteroidota bacterium]
MNIISHPERSKWPDLLKRPEINHCDLESGVQKIIHDVKVRGDVALAEYTRRFDGIDLDDFRVPEAELAAASSALSASLKKAIDEARSNIYSFHKKQLAPVTTIVTTAGVKCWQKPVPMSKVGLYIPGGSAPLLSTVLMLGVPAKIAGCPEVVLCTPPDKDGKIDPGILYIAGLLGIDKVFRVGGAQAIAAMAHGTESIPAVSKIFGPGNQYVTMAKQLVSRETVAIDMPAGPSELVVVADSTSNPAFIASDLLSQAEHGPDSQVLLITDSGDMIGRVQEALKNQLADLPRKEIAIEALKHSKMILLQDFDLVVDMVNDYAPEHLIIVTENYLDLAERIVNAGSVFLGDYTPESAGDYASGTNHTLPTNGWARSYSGVNMDSFYKKISFQEISRYGLHNIGDAIVTMAEAERLQAHANAVSIRLRNNGNGESGD